MKIQIKKKVIKVYVSALLPDLKSECYSFDHLQQFVVRDL